MTRQVRKQLALKAAKATVNREVDAPRRLRRELTRDLARLILKDRL